MKSFAVLSSLVAVVAAACGGDNCARQVTGTRDGLEPVSSRMADCASFLATTVVPDAATVTVTVTVDPEEPAKFRREYHKVRAATEVPTAIPAYASSCDSPARFSSACSCWGVTATVTTAAQPTTTVTSTVTSDYCEDL